VRFLAFPLFAFAAFDWPLPWLDRLGTAALGLAFLALAVGSQTSSLRRALPFDLSPKTVAVADDPMDEALSMAQRIAAYDLPEPRA